MNNLSIGIDARELSKPHPGGFRSYVRGLLSGLAEVDPENEYTLYVDRPLDDDALKLPCKCSFVLVSRNRVYADHWDLRRAISSHEPHLVHFPCNYGLCGLGVPVVITLMDCIALNGAFAGASLKSRLLARYMTAMIRRSVPRADAVLTISEYARSEIVRRFEGADRISVAYPGINPGLKALRAKDFRLRLEVPYVVCLASPDPRKNVASIVRAFSESRLPREGCRLAVVVNHPSAKKMIPDCTAPPGAVVLLENVSDGELARLYSESIALVFASIDEGFGLPPLEAMAFGCPVISSNAAAMPEVLGDAALYFDPFSVSELVHRLEQVWVDLELREKLRALGTARQQSYSWKRNAEQTLAVYERIVSSATWKNRKRHHSL